MTAPARGGAGGGGGRGGGGGGIRGGGGGGGGGGRGGGGEGEGGGGGGGEFWCSPPTDSPNPLEAAKLHRRTLGLIYGFTQRDPPPPHDGPFAGWGSVGRGLEVGNRGNPNRNL